MEAFDRDGEDEERKDRVHEREEIMFGIIQGRRYMRE